MALINISDDLLETLTDMVEARTEDRGTDYHLFCHFCGSHNEPYETFMFHREGCHGLKLLKLLSEAKVGETAEPAEVVANGVPALS